MAKEVLTLITDDLDGSKDASTVSFALEGTEYSIDLGSKNLKKLRDALAPYVAVAERVPATRSARRSKTATTGKSKSAVVREWAAGAGVEVPARGRIPQSVMDAYEAAK